MARAAQDRMTKGAVREELTELRMNLIKYTAMSGHELLAVYNERFLAEKKESASREFCLAALMTSDIWRAAAVLGVD